MFNWCMDTYINIIDELGGPKKVAEMLGILDEPGAIQRVGNWRRRGIPAKVLVDNPSFFKKVARLKSREPTHV